MPAQPLIRIQRGGSFGDTLEIRVALRDEATGSMRIAQPVIMKLREESTTSLPDYEEPMLTLTHWDAPDFLRSMMDQLWAMGIRPSDTGTPGHLAATEAHLKTCKDIIDKILPVLCQKQPSSP